MDHLIQGFSLGNSAILTNVCLLPLYPGLVAFLAGNANNENSKKSTKFLGLLVLAGVLSLMLIMSVIVFSLQASFGIVLYWLLPLIYTSIILIGITMLLGFNPFNRLATVQAPMLKNPYITAYLYGLFLGPMTLPCTGPIIVSSILLSSGSTQTLFREMGFFLAFGIGFGWPLVVLPLFSMSLQRRATGWLNKNHGLLTRISGLIIIAIGVWGIKTEIIPQFF